MHRLSEILLAILLTLLLGFSPLTGAVAGITASYDQEEGTHQMASMPADMVMAFDHATAHDCEQCNTDDCCAGDSCSSGHCVHCVSALPAIYSHQTQFTASPVLIRADDSFINRLSASLFRPPRA